MGYRRINPAFLMLLSESCFISKGFKDPTKGLAKINQH